LIDSFISSIQSFIHSFILSFIHSLTHSFTYSITHPLSDYTIRTMFQRSINRNVLFHFISIYLSIKQELEHKTCEYK